MHLSGKRSFYLRNASVNNDMYIWDIFLLDTVVG